MFANINFNKAVLQVKNVHFVFCIIYQKYEPVFMNMIYVKYCF